MGYCLYKVIPIWYLADIADYFEFAGLLFLADLADCADPCSPRSHAVGYTHG